MTLYDELIARGLIAQVTDEEKVKELINSGKATFYIGFDPTADSLHVGHFMALCLMRRLQSNGNKPIALLGGGTALIGDPSGKTDMRKMLTAEDINHNAECFKKQMSRFIDFSDGKALMVNNADWLLRLNYVELLREVGACFSVNNMLRAECYKQRMEKGLTFLEFNYMIMQSYDFYHLYQEYGCNFQFGGDDQWSNMLGGRELIRRKLGKDDAEAMTITLLLNSEGKKMGKTVSGAVWLDPEKTSSLRVLPVLAERRGCRRDQVHARCSPMCPWIRSRKWRLGRTLSSTEAKAILALRADQAGSRGSGSGKGTADLSKPVLHRQRPDQYAHHRADRRPVRRRTDHHRQAADLRWSCHLQQGGQDPYQAGRRPGQWRKGGGIHRQLWR